MAVKPDTGGVPLANDFQRLPLPLIVPAARRAKLGA
jgi:hypothetical protein